MSETMYRQVLVISGLSGRVVIEASAASWRNHHFFWHRAALELVRLERLLLFIRQHTIPEDDVRTGEWYAQRLTNALPIVRRQALDAWDLLLKLTLLQLPPLPDAGEDSTDG